MYNLKLTDTQQKMRSSHQAANKLIQLSMGYFVAGLFRLSEMLFIDHVTPLCSKTKLWH